MPLRYGHIIEKTRSIVPCGSRAWEVDRFSGDNSGLVIAEIELPDENYDIKLPPWIGAEVTGQTQYYNGTLAQYSFSSWQQADFALIAQR